MSHAVNIPKLGLTMEEAVIAEWQIEDGQRVAKGAHLLTIETEKVMFDVEAEAEGFLQRVAPVGASLKVGELAGCLHASAEQALQAALARPASAFSSAPAAAAATSAAAAASPADPPAPPDLQMVGSTNPPAEAVPHPARLAAVGKGAQRILASPVARLVAQERRVALASVPGSGPGGVILKRDVLQAAAAPAAASSRRPMSSMRRTISQRMAHSLASTAQMTGFGRIDMAEAVSLREALLAQQPQLGVRITYTDLVLKACACVLRELPGLNSSIDGDDVVTWNEVHLGLAVAVQGGLLVPVIHHADRLSLVEICRERQRLIEKARSGALAREDLEGGTFTLSNFGSYGGDFETPILNAPQSALLGIGRIADEPVVRDKQIVIRPMMMMSLTFDHRLIDGADAGRFRSRLRELLEQPGLMLAQLR